MKKSKITTILCIFSNLFIFVILFIVYGPIPKFRNWFITTSLASGNHKWFAKVLYSDDTIKKTMMANKTNEVNEDTDVNSITFVTDKESYDSIYEKQILEHEDDAVYKVIRIKENDYSGYLVAIYDSSRINLVTSSNIEHGGQTMESIARENEAIVAINASGFARKDGALIPTGTVIQDGKVVSVGGKNTHGGGLIGFTKNNVLMLTTDSAENAIKKGMDRGMTFGPFLIVNGVASDVKGNGGFGVANRTAIAQRKDGIVLFLIIDGRGADGSNGITIADMIPLLERYGAYNAANLDGGGSSTLVIEDELINNPRGYSYTGERYLPNAWIVK
jgi:exopolysaccharide biosynthesis protein